MAARRTGPDSHFLPKTPAPLSWRGKFKSRRPLPYRAAPTGKRTADTSLSAPSARTSERPQSPRWPNAGRRRGRRYRRRACLYGCPQHRDKGHGRAPLHGEARPRRRPRKHLRGKLQGSAFSPPGSADVSVRSRRSETQVSLAIPFQMRTTAKSNSIVIVICRE